MYSIYIEISLKMLEDNAGPPQTCEDIISQHYSALQDSQMATPKAMEDIRNMTSIVLEHLLYQHIHLPQKLIQV